MERRINELIKYCISDSLKDEIPGLDYQLFTMTMRSMLPFENKIGCKFDEDRYLDEIKTLRYYINGEDKLVINKIKQNSAMTTYDSLLEYKIIPIIIANAIWENVINEVLKCLVFYTYSKESILEAIVLSSVLHEYIENSCVDKGILHSITKQRLIEFSIKDFFQDNFDTAIKNTYNVSFERERIMHLMKDNILENDMFSDKRITNYILNEASNNNDIIADANISNLLNLSSYLYKLRKGVVDPRKIKYISSANVELKPNIIQGNFIHPILGKCLVIQRTENEAIVKTKTGNIRVRV
jgi:hypothetical protein